MRSARSARRLRTSTAFQLADTFPEIADVRQDLSQLCLEGAARPRLDLNPYFSPEDWRAGSAGVGAGPGAGPAVPADRHADAIVLRALRQYGLAQTELAQAQWDTIRVKLLKIGAVIGVHVRRVRVA